MARDHGLLDAREVGEVHTAHGVALAAQGRHAEALPELERGVFLRRLWGQPLDLADGLIALAPAVAAAGDRARAAALFDEAEALLAGCPDPGALPARLAAARRAASAGEPLTERERDDPALPERRARPSARSARELFLSFNTVHSHVKSLYRKLGVSSRAEAVDAASPR